MVSVKASDVVKTVEASQAFDKISDYPQHIGITEAGTLAQGLIKSGAGLGYLLFEGIGDTIRISLSGDPVREVRAAWDLLNACGLRHRGVDDNIMPDMRKDMHRCRASGRYCAR